MVKEALILLLLAGCAAKQQPVLVSVPAPAVQEPVRGAKPPLLPARKPEPSDAPVLQQVDDLSDALGRVDQKLQKPTK